MVERLHSGTVVYTTSTLRPLSIHTVMCGEHRCKTVMCRVGSHWDLAVVLSHIYACIGSVHAERSFLSPSVHAFTRRASLHTVMCQAPLHWGLVLTQLHSQKLPLNPCFGIKSVTVILSRAMPPQQWGPDCSPAAHQNGKDRASWLPSNLAFMLEALL